MLGFYQFKVMPFGYGAPATFQCLIQGLEDFAEAYLDNIVIFSDTLEGHLQHVKRVLLRLKESHLTAKPVNTSLAFRNASIWVMSLAMGK